MLRFLSVELSSRLIINDLRLTAALNVSGGFPYRPGSRSTVMARHASALKGKPIWFDVIELREKASRDRFQDQVQLPRTEHPEGFVSGEQ
jgi:hypothetical protein